MRGWLVWVACSVTVLRAMTATACPAIPRTYELETVEPAPDVSAVPLNMPLVVHLVDAPPGAPWDGTVFTTVAPITELETARTVDVSMVTLGPRENSVTAFVPLAPLAPNTTYVVNLGRPPAVAAGEGAPDPVWQFTTGAALQPPLRLKGELSVTFEMGTDPVFVCPPSPALCGSSCVQDGEKSVTKARLELPASFDGFASLGVQGELRISENLAPGEISDVAGFDTPKVVAGQPTEALVTMPLGQDGSAYAPCFELTVMDAHGDQVKSSLCLDEPFPLPQSADQGTTGMAGQAATDDGAGVAGQAATDGVARAHTSSACGFAPPAETSDSAALLLACGLVLMHYRRKTSDSARPSGRGVRFLRTREFGEYRATTAR